MESAYIVGIAEDAYLGKGGKTGYVFDIESKNRIFIQRSVAKRLSIILNKPVRVRKRPSRPYYRIRVWSRSLIRFVRSIMADPTIVLKWPINAQLLWVRGFIDAEGSVTLSGEKQPMLSVYNKNKLKLKIIEKILGTHKIIAHYYKSHSREVWQQYFTGRENLTILLKVVKIEHPEKNSKLLLFLQ
ncbi:MAG: LAGLIDADG family homing endonuclease [Candidatus Odinarchaeia archaeon]